MSKRTPKQQRCYNALYTERKQEKGFVRVQLWTPPDGRATLQSLAKRLREDALAARLNGEPPKG
jgi:hypothetical protein